MVKLIHFADFHLGVDTYGSIDPVTKLSGRVLDLLDSLDALVDYAEENDADLVLFAGDAFHKNTPDPTLLREFGDRVVRLARQCPVVLLVGNHDMSGVIEKASAVDIFGTLQVPNVTVGYDYQLYKIKTKSGVIQVGTAPYPIRGQFLTHKEKLSDDSKEIWRRKISKALKRLASQVDISVPAVLVGHFSVDTAIFGSERTFYIGDDAEVSIEDLVTNWNYVALGHIHLYQNLTEKFEGLPPVIYAGSLDRVSFSEEHDPKGFIWVEIDEDETRWEFVHIDARPFVTIALSVEGVNNQTKRIISKVQKTDVVDAIVRLEVSADAGRSSTINRKAITDELYKCGAFYVHGIAVNEKHQKRTRIDFGNVRVTEMSDKEKLDLYFEKVMEYDSKEIERLGKLAADIMKKVNNDQSI